MASAQVDLNPHQVDAALFAFKSPLSKGALLADEVGLGKTIEAGLVLSQKWAERKRRILVITPVQPAQAMAPGADREVLPALPHPRSQVLQRGDQARAVPPVRGARTIVICSYQFARSKAADVHARAVGPRGDRRSAPPAQRLQAVERHRQHAQAGAGRQAQAAAHRDAAAELAAGAVRPGQLHRRARLRRSQELPRAVRQSQSGAGVSRRSRRG